MSKAGGGSAYVRLQVPQDGMNQALQYWGARAGQEKDAKKLADERVKIRKDKEVAEWEDKFGLKEGDFANKYTGFKSFDDMNTDFSIYASDKYVELQRQAKEALMNGDLKEKTKLEGEMIRIKNAFGEASKSQKFFADKFKDYQKAVQEGRVSGASKDFEDIVQASILDKNVALRFQDGNLVYTGLANGKPFVVPYQDLMDGSFGYYQKQQVSGDGGLVDNILNDLGKITRQTNQGYYNITTQAWDDGQPDGIHSKATMDAIEALVGNDEVMGDLLYQFSGGKTSKMFGYNEKDYDLVKNKMKELVRAGYDEKFGSQFNNSKYATDSANARRNKKDEDSSLSNLHFDANRFMEGDYTGLLGRHENEFEEEVNIRQVVPAPNGNYVIAVTDTGDRIEVPKTKRGFLEFKIRGKSEYKGLTPEKVMETQPVAYRNERIGDDEVLNVVQGQYSSSGEFIGEETELRSQLSKLYPEAKIEEAIIGTNALKINGTKINFDELTKEQAEQEIKNALGINTSGYKANTNKKSR